MMRERRLTTWVRLAVPSGHKLAESAPRRRLHPIVRRFRFIWFWVVGYSSFEVELSGVRSESGAASKPFGVSSAPSPIVAKVNVPSSILKKARTTLPMLIRCDGGQSLMVACSCFGSVPAGSVIVVSNQKFVSR